MSTLRHQPQSYCQAAHQRNANESCMTQVAGYCHAPAQSYQPPPQLQQFLETGPPPVYFGFGSMPVNQPEVTLAQQHAVHQVPVGQCWWYGQAPSDRSEE